MYLTQADLLHYPICQCSAKKTVLILMHGCCAENLGFYSVCKVFILNWQYMYFKWKK